MNGKHCSITDDLTTYTSETLQDLIIALCNEFEDAMYEHNAADDAVDSITTILDIYGIEYHVEDEDI